MPIELIAILFMPFTMLCFFIGAALHDMWHEDAHIPVFLIWLFSLLFIIGDFNFNSEKKVEEKILITKTVDNIDFIIDDGEFVNLNSKLSRDIEEGQEIKKVTTTYTSLLSKTVRSKYEALNENSP